MKQRKILALVLAALMVTAVLASCGKNDAIPAAAIDDYLNPEYNNYDEVVSSLSVISGLEGYVVQSSNNEFAVLTKLDTDLSDSVDQICKVVSLRTGMVVGSFSNTSSTDTVETTQKISRTEYSIQLLQDDVPAFTVTKESTKITISPVDTDSSLTTTYTLFDATGVAVVEQNVPFSGSMETLMDWIIIEDVIYDINEDTGALTKKSDVPAGYRTLSSYEATDANLYVESGDSIIVYDYDFKMVDVWTLPANASINSWFVLNNGDIMIQYTTELDPNAKEYALYDGTTLADMEKYNLTTLIYSMAEKTEEEIEFNYIISGGKSRYSINMMEDDDGVYATDAFENIVFVYPIADKKVDYSAARRDFLVIDNEGTILNSLKIAEYQTGLPTKIGTDKYLVETLYGSVIVDGNGAVVAEYNGSNFMRIGDYFVDRNSSFGIYDMEFDVVYDFSAENAVFIGSVNDTIFVRDYTDAKHTNYSVLGFAKGNRFTVCSYHEDNEFNQRWNLISGAGIYSLYDAETKEYNYYNVDGAKLLNSTANATEVVCGNGTVSLVKGTMTVEGVITNVYFIGK